MMVTPNTRSNHRGRSQSNTERVSHGAARNRTPESTQQRKSQKDRVQKTQNRPQAAQTRQSKPNLPQTGSNIRNRRATGQTHPIGQRVPKQHAPRQTSVPQKPSVATRARTHTPANRRAARATRRIDPRQLEIQRRKQEAHKFYVRKRRRNAFRLFLGRFVIFLAMFAILFSSAIGIILLRYYSYEKPISEIVYQIGADEDEDMTSRKLKRESILIDDTLYINITEIALLCEFTTTGDLNEIRLISKNESNDNVKLVPGSPVVVVNGNSIRLSAPVLQSGEAIYVPYEFFTGYVTGISVTYDTEKNKVTIVRELVGMTEAKLNKPSEPIYADICFTLKYPTVTDSIPEDSLDLDIRIATEPKNTAEDTQS